MKALASLLWKPFALLVGLGLFYFKGRSDNNKSRDAQKSAEYRDTRKRMDDAENSISDDDGVLRDWLSQRGTKRDL